MNIGEPVTRHRIEPVTFDAEFHDDAPQESPAVDVRLQPGDADPAETHMVDDRA